MTVAPVHVVLIFGVGATKTPFVAFPPMVVRSSVRDVIVSGLVSVFVKVIVKVEMPLGATVLG